MGELRARFLEELALEGSEGIITTVTTRSLYTVLKRWFVLQQRLCRRSYCSLTLVCFPVVYVATLFLQPAGLV
jgi:hypothetical protein